MRADNNYEKLDFHQTINTIPADYFPTSYPVHWHKYVEITMLPIDVTINHLPVIKINQETYTLQPGDILFIWPGELHEIIENSESKLIGLQFSGMIFNESPDFTPFTNLFRTYRLIQRTDEELSQIILPHLQHIFSLKTNKGLFDDVRTSICLYELFIDFGTYLHHKLNQNLNITPSIQSSSLDKINLACSYIQENCDQTLTLNMAADYIGFSSYYFSRLFKQYTSYNFVEYLTIQRIKNAQRLLADSKLSITEVCYQSGFTSISTFNRAFHQSLGCSPRDYRKYYLKDHGTIIHSLNPGPDDKYW